ncbi:menaquinol-cytochrome C reductase [Thermaerobacter sp. PB12/4term]|uniref:menaquinol-cytochrome C reductase n=1 Tax=Thermaerobacter sp. PB12/4term TaxID=2293838 RepID=UPI000E32D013|nr:menaquinol-cytochrome C reductase [Thermaerobacter sp. PB12/4term]QIA26371.1 menaquinol-cytochrome C reductase [Thermaerobacter sp. PB12/4term]
MAQPQPAPAATGEEPQRPNPKEQVTVWPHLLLIEFVGALIYTIGLSLLAILIKAPLLELANPSHTPNPAKAPWYFLNLQELLLHMHPSLAGVIVPGLVLVLIAAIPYIDTDPSDTGVWFAGEKGLRIFKFSFLYTSLIVLGLILFDAFFAVNVGGVDYIGTRGLVAAVFGLFMSPEAIHAQAQLVEHIAGVVIPLIVMAAVPGVLAVIVRRRYQANTRETIIALFTVFVASYFVLTIIGTGFRGESLHLVWPWQLEPPH